MLKSRLYDSWGQVLGNHASEILDEKLRIEKTDTVIKQIGWRISFFTHYISSQFS